MRCSCCDVELNEYESTRKSKTTGQYLDMCDTCFNEVADVFIDVEVNEELRELEQDLGEDNHELF